MNRFDAKSKFCAYLKRYNISFIEDFDNGAARIAMVYKGYGYGRYVCPRYGCE